MTQDQFTQVSKKVSDIPAEDFTINIELFLQTFTNVELVQQNWIVSKVTSPGREPRFSNLLSDALPLRHTLFLIYEYIEGYKRRSGATSLLYSLLFTLYLYLYLYLYNFVLIVLVIKKTQRSYIFTLYSLLFTLYLYLYLYLYNFFYCFGDYTLVQWTEY